MRTSTHYVNRLTNCKANKRERRLYVKKSEDINLEPTNLLDDWLLDWSIFSLKHRTWTNRHELWRKFIRS